MVSAQPKGTCGHCCKVIPSKHIKLWLYNHQTSPKGARVKMRRQTGALHAAGIDAKAPSIFFIHGFSEHALSDSAKHIRDGKYTSPAT